MRIPTRSVFVLVMFALAGCVGTDVGNPQDNNSSEKADVELHFEGYEQTHQSALVYDGGTRISSAWMVLDRFRFQSSANCGDDSPYDIVEPVVIDLLSDEHTYPALTFTRPAGNYCQLGIGLTRATPEDLPEGAPQSLTEHAIVVEGERADGVPFSIRGNSNGHLHLARAMESFQLEAGHQSLIVGFALNTWIDEEELDSIEDEDPIIIDADRHRSLLSDFHRQVRYSAGLFRDDNGDARLDAEEQRNSMAQGQDEARENNGRGDEESDAARDEGLVPDVGP